MKQLHFMLFSILLSTMAASQTKEESTVINDPHAEARSVSVFNAVKVSNGITVLIKQGNSEGVAVSASEQKYTDKIKTIVENGVLKIYYDNGNQWVNERGNKKLKAYVSVKTLVKISGSLGSNIIMDGTLSSQNLTVDLSSGSNIKGEVQAEQLNIDESSGAIARLTGKAKSITIETSSGSGFYGYEFHTDICNARATSGGHIEITVNKEMEVKASSGGGISYKGNGVIKNISTGSGGRVSKNG